MRFAVVLACLLMLAACGGTPADVGFVPPERACTPGAQVECACPGGAPKGVQSCRVDGSGYDQCACTANVDAGAGDAADPTTADSGTVSLDGAAGPDGGRGPDGQACSGSLDTDSENCGACGHSCLGGACQAGVCAFTELASNQSVPSGLAVGGGSVFWTTEGANPDYVGSVLRLSLSDPAATPTVLASGSQNYPRALSFTDGALYWGAYGDGAIGKWTNAGGSASLGAAPSGRLYNVVSDAAYVYFSMEIAKGNMPVSGAVGRCPLDGCAGAPELVATADAKIIGLAIDQGVLFWSVFSSSGAIYGLTLDGASSPRALAVGQASPLNVAAFGGFVYWVNTASGTVARMSADESADAGAATMTILANNQPTPWGIAADDRGVYWTTYTRSGQIMKLPHGASTPLVLASAQPSPGHVRLDANYAYWTNTDGSIRRVPR
jgi:hypothetical protein